MMLPPTQLGGASSVLRVAASGQPFFNIVPCVGKVDKIRRLGIGTRHAIA